MGDKSIKGRSPILTKGQRLLNRGIVRNQKAVKVEEYKLEKQEPQLQTRTKHIINQKMPTKKQQR